MIYRILFIIMKIGVFGSIGVGKSSLSKILSEKFNLKLIEEPVITNPYIDKYYENPKKYGIKFQMRFLISRYEYVNIKLNTDNDNFILDRTFYEDKIFADVNYNIGNINDCDYKNLYMPYYNLMKDKIIKLDKIIYLSASVKKLMERIKKRGREYEKSIKEDYLQELEIGYEKSYNELKNSGIDIIKVDWEEFDNDKVIDLISCCSL